eukprot:scpid102304/ scgid17811/ 
MASSKRFFMADEARASVLDKMTDEVYGQSDEPGGAETSSEETCAVAVMAESEDKANEDDHYLDVGVDIEDAIEHCRSSPTGATTSGAHRSSSSCTGRILANPAK